LSKHKTFTAHFSLFSVPGTQVGKRWSSHLPLDHIDSSDTVISPTQFYIWQKTGCGIRSFCPSKRKNRNGCWDTT